MPPIQRTAPLYLLGLLLAGLTVGSGSLWWYHHHHPQPKRHHNLLTGASYPVLPVTYPPTPQGDTVDTYHDVAVPDPYRWLEDNQAPEVHAWVEQQNAQTQAHLEKIPFRAALRQRYETLRHLPKLLDAQQAGSYFVVTQSDGHHNQPIIYRQAGLMGEKEVLLDPNTLSSAGTVALQVLACSPDGRYMAYAQTQAGSDWQVLRVMEVATGRRLYDKLQWAKFTRVTWRGRGFYYSRYPPPPEGKESTAPNRHHTVYYHRLGTPQSADTPIYANPEKPELQHTCDLTEDGRYLVVYAHTGSGNSATYYKDLRGGDWQQLGKAALLVATHPPHHGRGDGFFCDVGRCDPGRAGGAGGLCWPPGDQRDDRQIPA